MIKLELQREVHAVLTRLANGQAVNGITCPPINVPMVGNLRLLGSATKTEKGEDLAGTLTAIMYLSPADSGGILKSGKRLSVCPWFSPGCRAGCLGEHSGRMRHDSTSNAQRWKTALYAAAPNLMRDLIAVEASALERKAAKLGLEPAIRLDGTSDIGLALLWNLPQAFPAIRWYDYTKSIKRLDKVKAVSLPNYHITFSASERKDSPTGAARALAYGYSVAAIVNTGKPDAALLTRKVLDLAGSIPSVTVADGDNSVGDARFRDKPSTLVWLTVKGGQPVATKLGAMVFRV